MKILVLTLNAWNDSKSTGNTVSNLFSGFSSDDIANIYCRDEEIKNKICKNYFKVTEKDIISSVLSRKECGTVIKDSFCDAEIKHNDILATNRKTGNWLRKYKPASLLLLRELIWDLPIWRNNKLDKFLEEFAPDVIYMHGHCNLYMHKLLDYCAKKTNAKIAMYWGDDMYGRKHKAPLAYFYETLLRRRFRHSISGASLLFGGSLKLCAEYSSIFSKEFKPFFKECKNTEFLPAKAIGNPITIVYAGNLLFGREEIMVKLVNAMSLVNAKSETFKFKLTIYSNTQPSEESLDILNDRKNSFFMGCKEYSIVCSEMNKADFSLFIESFEMSCIKQTRLSFSTKIIDCMQSSAAMIAIGPKEIASMEYIAENKIGYAITKPEQLEDKLNYLRQHTEIIAELINKKNDFAAKNHVNTSFKALELIMSL